MSSMKILIVDDSSLARKMVRRALSGVVHSIEEASGGLEAVNAVKAAMENRTPFHLVIVDYHLNDMDGADAVSAVRSMGFFGDAIALTGSTNPEERTRLLEAGCSRILLKPVSSESLRSSIELVSGPHGTFEASYENV
jgi:CheY-like chemotaxis protein